MNKSFFKSGFVFICALFIGLFTSCQKIKGYGIVLWNLPEYNLQDGDVVPVYIRSNITQQYVIGTRDGKAEVSLWQISEPVSKGKAKKLAATKYNTYRHQYATVAMNGLPMRAEPVNTAKQVYRLKKDEVIKVLYEINGQPPMTGGKPLEGKWFRVLTTDGTQGCCFSYNLRLFETDITGQRVGGTEVVEQKNDNADFDSLLANRWYPDTYRNMIESGRIDPSKFNLSYYFQLDTENKKLYFSMEGVNRSWDYKGAVSSGANAYALTEIPIIVTVRRDNYIVVRYTGPSGKPEDFNLVTISQDINELIAQEIQRREKEYEQIYMFGPAFKSDSYGTLTLSEDHGFTWNNKNLLSSSGIISQNVSNKGNAQIKYFLIKNLQNSYDGVLTFKFDGYNKEINFLYKMEANGLRLEDATGATMDNGTIRERGMSPLVLFFSNVE